MKKRIKGGIVLFDPEDKDLVDSVAWRICREGYARDSSGRVLLHREILKSMGPCPKGHISDHRNGKRFDNRRSNLRWSTWAQNCQNAAQTKRKFGKRCRSPYKGVYRVRWPHERRCWGAHIGFKGRLLHIGYFPSAGKAALAYNEKAKELFREFVRPNVIRRRAA